jgi:hypothetical protein
VEGAKAHLIDPVKICGTGLNVPIRRHRLFETDWLLDVAHPPMPPTEIDLAADQ